MTYLEQNTVSILLGIVNSIEESGLTLGFYDGDNPCEDLGKSESLIIAGVLRDYISNVGSKE